jgi:RNase P subunit RPR2
MRLVAVLAAVVLPASLAWGHGMDDRVPDARELADLQAKAAAASPNEQPYIYAELVHSMTEIATAQFQAGDQEHGSASLKAAQNYAQKIQMSLLRDAKKLKSAEILIRHTAFRLKELMTGASLDDRPTLEATISQLNQVQSDMITQIFRH